MKPAEVIRSRIEQKSKAAVHDALVNLLTIFHCRGAEILGKPGFEVKQGCSHTTFALTWLFGGRADILRLPGSDQVLVENITTVLLRERDAWWRAQQQRKAA